MRPVAEAANSAFGTRSVFNGQARSPHGGADFLSPAGTVVKAPAGGRVLLARDLYYTGGTIMIDHGAGLISLFAHLSAIDVKEAADVAAGTAIGKVGATGPRDRSAPALDGTCQRRAGRSPVGAATPRASPERSRAVALFPM